MIQQYVNGSDLVTSNGDDASQNFKRMFVRLVRLWPWFVISLVVFCSVAYLYLASTNNVYRAVASIMVKDDSKGADAVDDGRLKELGLTSNSKLVVNEIEILKSYDLMQYVVDSLKLYVSVRKKELFRKVPLFQVDCPFNIEVINPNSLVDVTAIKIRNENGVLILLTRGKKPQPLVDGGEYLAGTTKFRISNIHSAVEKNAEYFIDLIPRQLVVMQYHDKLDVEPANKLSTVINIAIKDNNRNRASQVLNTLLVIYNQQELENKNRNTNNTIAFLNDRLYNVARELQAVESSVERLKSNNKVTRLSDDAEQYLHISRDVDAQKAQYQTKLNIINALESELSGAADQLVPSTFGLEDASLQALLDQYNKLLQEKLQLEKRSGPQHPLIIDMQSQLASLRGRILRNVQNLKQASLIALEDLSKKDDKLSGLIQNVPQLEKQLVEKTRIQSVQEQLYSFLLQKREEATVSQASNIQDSRIVVRARDVGAVSPKRNVIWTIAVVLAFAVPVVFFRIRSMLNNKVGEIAEVEQRASLPLIGIISHIKSNTGRFVIDAQSRSVVAEQFRHLRSSIAFALNKNPARRILVTSYQPADGKSFVSLNLAATYSLLKKKTILLEFDLRKPHIALDFGLASQEGISNILEGSAKLNDLIMKVDDYNDFLYILPAGRGQSNPAELISGPLMQTLMSQLMEKFEYIIINSPPVGVVTDANLLQKYADLTLMVIRQDHTSSNVFRELKIRSASQIESPLFIVMNDVGKRKIYRGEYGYGNYAYNMGKGYYTH